MSNAQDLRIPSETPVQDPRTATWSTAQPYDFNVPNKPERSVNTSDRPNLRLPAETPVQNPRNAAWSTAQPYDFDILKKPEYSTWTSGVLWNEQPANTKRIAALNLQRHPSFESIEHAKILERELQQGAESDDDDWDIFGDMKEKEKSANGSLLHGWSGVAVMMVYGILVLCIALMYENSMARGQKGQLNRTDTGARGAVCKTAR